MIIVREFSSKLRDRWRTYLLCGLFWSVLIVPLAATFIYISIHEGDNSRPHLPELRKLADEIPLYPGAQKTDDRVMLKPNIALLTVFYRSNSSFSDVQSFYRRELLSRGWTPPNTQPNRFDLDTGDYRYGEYVIAVERDTYSNNFSIAFKWQPQ